MAISRKVRDCLERASWIRKMFEQGAVLRREFGDENVFDFSIGNPNLEPPQTFFTALEAVVQQRERGRHGYMPNAGYRETREAVAEYLSQEHGVEIFAEHVIMSCGAGGGLNVVLKTLLDPGDEVLVPVPYFVEYGFYVDNAGGSCRFVKSNNDFSLDLGAIEAALTEKTKAVIINSPHNPTGVVYSRASISALAGILDAHSRKLGQETYLISDEPYSKIVYDGVTVASIIEACPNSIIVSSYSKDLSIPGERLGFIAVNPRIAPLDDIMEGLVFATRTLGFVNAPALMQRVVRQVQGQSVDIARYQRKRDLLCDMLQDLGYSFVRPQGAFYLFPQSPVDDVAFVRELQQERILAVPGSGFGCPGYFRLSYCVDDKTIERSADGFAILAKKYYS